MTARDNSSALPCIYPPDTDEEVAAVARPRMQVGASGKVSLTAQVYDEERHRYVTAARGARKVARWRARARVRDGDGQLREVERYAPTKAKAQVAIEAALRAREAPASNSLGLRPGTTVAQAASVWLAHVRDQGSLAPGTVAAYTSTIRRYVVGTSAAPGQLAGLTLREVTVGALDGALHRIAIDSGPGAAKLARTVYSGLFGLAVRHGALATNPVRDVSPLRRNSQRSTSGHDTRRALSREELALFLTRVDADASASRYDIGDLVHFLSGTGVRIGEALALRWAQVDLLEGTVRVAATLTRSPRQGLVIQEHPKSTAGVRTLYLPAWLVQRLEARYARRPGLDQEPVFPSPEGYLWDPRNVSRHLRVVFDSAGLTWATAHTLRRTVATLMDEAGLSARETANQLGHARPSLTQDVYMDRRRSPARAADVL